MTQTEIPQRTTIELLEQAIALHRAGSLSEAASYYQQILRCQPAHPLANYNLGVLALQTQRPTEGLPHLLAALQADPTQGQFWLSYVDALRQVGRIEDAQEALALARLHGLQGEQVDALEADLSMHENPSPAANTAAGAAPQETAPAMQEQAFLDALFRQGDCAAAETLARKMTVDYPQHWFGWKILGVLLSQQGQHAEALLPLQKTVELMPADAESHNNLGITLQHLLHFAEAERSYRHALRLNPGLAQANCNLGALSQAMGHLQDALSSYQRALQIDPAYTRARNNLGAVLYELGRLGEAEASFRRALQEQPDSIDALNNLCMTLHDQGRLVEAEVCCRRIFDLDAANSEACFNLGNIFKAMGRLVEAESAYLRALQLNPEYAEAYGNLGLILHERGCFEAAEANYRKALAIRPEYAEAHNNLGSTLNVQGRMNEAARCFSKAFEMQPDFVEALCNLGGIQHDLGQLDEAEASFRQALRLKPDFAEAHSNLLFCLAQRPGIDAHTLFDEHCLFGERIEAKMHSGDVQHDNVRDPDRRLHIGFVSGDLRDHAVAYFIEPALSGMSQCVRLSLHAYSNHGVEDATTRRLRAYFASWLDITFMPDEALAAQFRSDCIDILIDLSGHTARNRLPVFARKPAPVQATWIGYPGTTGLRTMDYLLTDHCLLPYGKFDAQLTEKIAYLPASVSFLPSPDAPPVNALPALRNGYLTFASFNRLSKLTRETVALWGRLLRAVPDSRLLLAGMPPAGSYAALLAWFEQEGIARERLQFHERSSIEDYLALHHQVDIALDAFPYGGGTTTLHALWMGVPTLTLAGGTIASRSGASILGNVGLEAFVAEEMQTFVNSGVEWASALDALALIRGGLRERYAQSAMAQPKLIAASLERALRIMWQRWCAGLSAQTFEVTQTEVLMTMQEVTID